MAAAIKRNKAYRDAFVKSQIRMGVSAQIRALREARGWTQKKLGQRVKDGMAQEVISRLESPGYGKLTLTTALRLASAFDVGLVMRFAPFSDLVDWADGFSSDQLVVASVVNDHRLDVPFPPLAWVTPTTPPASRDQQIPPISGAALLAQGQGTRTTEQGVAHPMSPPRAINE